ncbi:hypothetical protein ACFQZ4_28780 [Catellatospora coxensis]
MTSPYAVGRRKLPEKAVCHDWCWPEMERPGAARDGGLIVARSLRPGRAHGRWARSPGQAIECGTNGPIGEYVGSKIV